MLIVDTNVLVDVLEDDPDWAEWSIGQLRAHAAVARCPLLTRDVRRYRAHFPTVELIAP